MASVVDICNLALGHVWDEAEVSSINPPDGSTQAAHCARFYPIARNTALEMYDWNFARLRESLALIDMTPPAGWSYAYSLPALCVKPRKILMPESTDDNATYPFDIESLADGSLVLYTNVESAVLIYTRLVTDTTKYTPLFVDALSRLLASYLAGPISKNPKLQESNYRMFLNLLPNAAASNANASQNHPYPDFVPEGVQARY